MDMIVCFGAPKNYDSQRPKHSHKYFAKQPGQKFQKNNNKSKFEIQVATRFIEAIIINEVYENLQEQ